MQGGPTHSGIDDSESESRQENDTENDARWTPDESHFREQRLIGGFLFNLFGAPGVTGRGLSNGCNALDGNRLAIVGTIPRRAIAGLYILTALIYGSKEEVEGRHLSFTPIAQIGRAHV